MSSATRTENGGNSSTNGGVEAGAKSGEVEAGINRGSAFESVATGGLQSADKASSSAASASDAKQVTQESQAPQSSDPQVQPAEASKQIEASRETSVTSAEKIAGLEGSKEGTGSDPQMKKANAEASVGHSGDPENSPPADETTTANVPDSCALSSVEDQPYLESLGNKALISSNSVRKLNKLDPSSSTIGQGATYLVSKAAECFIATIVNEGVKMAHARAEDAEEGSPLKKARLSYDDVRDVAFSLKEKGWISDVSFLHKVLPKKLEDDPKPSPPAAQAPVKTQEGKALTPNSVSQENLSEN